MILKYIGFIANSADYYKAWFCTISWADRIRLSGIFAIKTKYQPCAYVESIQTSFKIVICSKIGPKFDGLPTTDILPIPQM